MDTTTAPTPIASSIELVHRAGPDDHYGDEYAVIVRGVVRCYVRREDCADAERARIVKGIEADRRWFANKVTTR
jgi:hypothetical protein